MPTRHVTGHVRHACDYSLRVSRSSYCAPVAYTCMPPHAGEPRVRAASPQLSSAGMNLGHLGYGPPCPSCAEADSGGTVDFPAFTGPAGRGHTRMRRRRRFLLRRIRAEPLALSFVPCGRGPSARYSMSPRLLARLPGPGYRESLCT